MNVGDKVVHKKGHLFTKDAPCTITKQHAGNLNMYDIVYDDERAGGAWFVDGAELKPRH